MIAIPISVRPPKNISLFDRRHASPSENITRVPFSSTHHHDSHFFQRQAPSENITRVPFSSTHHHDSHSYQRQGNVAFHIRVLVQFWRLMTCSRYAPPPWVYTMTHPLRYSPSQSFSVAPLQSVTILFRRSATVRTILFRHPQTAQFRSGFSLSPSR